MDKKTCSPEVKQMQKRNIQIIILDTLGTSLEDKSSKKLYREWPRSKIFNPR